MEIDRIKGIKGGNDALLSVFTDCICGSWYVMKGNLTIEAAYLFPFCFFILSLICYLGIFLYNQAVLELTGYECVLQTMEEREIRDELFREKLYERAKGNSLIIYGLSTCMKNHYSMKKNTDGIY